MEIYYHIFPLIKKKNRIYFWRLIHLPLCNLSGLFGRLRAVVLNEGKGRFALKGGLLDTNERAATAVILANKGE
jgi:hypothetical protein